MQDVEVECEICNKPVKAKSIRITKNGRVYITLKCGHQVGFLLAGIIYPSSTQFKNAWRKSKSKESWG